MRVLVVEDERTFRDLLKDTLTRRGHEVVAVANAEMALALHCENPFPFVVLDWLLPGMSGIELCRVLRTMPNGAEPFVLLATARTSVSDLDSSLQAGVDDYLAKPLSLPLLTTRLAVAERAIAQRNQRREAEHRFEAVFRGNPDAIALICIADGTVLDANESFAQMFGMSRVSILDPASSVVGASLLAKLPLDMGRHVASEPVSFIRPSDAASLQLLVSVETVDAGGGACWLVMCRDVTERERLRSKLMLSEKMASVGTLAAGVAHEINNPLTYIMANLSYGLERWQELGGGDADVCEALSDALEGAQQVKRIVADLKTFAHPSEEVSGPIDLREVLESAIDLARNEVRHRARLVTEFSPLPKVIGNKGRLCQVFVNLLVNAAQAIVEGDATKHAIGVIARTSADGQVVVEIRDTGSGIRPEQLSRVFDPFFTTKDVGVGTGLGLSISHAIVASFGGSMSCISTLGEGATFSVALLPAPQRPLRHHSFAAAQEVSINSRTEQLGTISS